MDHATDQPPEASQMDSAIRQQACVSQPIDFWSRADGSHLPLTSTSCGG